MLTRLLQRDYRLEFWTYLNLTAPTFQEMGLNPEDSDTVVWQKCQQQQLVLITANRKKEGPDSLESTIRRLSTKDSLPVITLADERRILRDKAYAERAADQLLEYLVEIDRYRGTERLYVP